MALTPTKLLFFVAHQGCRIIRKRDARKFKDVICSSVGVVQQQLTRGGIAITSAIAIQAKAPVREFVGKGSANAVFSCCQGK